MPTSDHNSFSSAFNLDIADGSDIEYLRAEKTIFFWSFSKLVMMSLVEGPMIFVPASPLGLHGLLRVPPIVAATQFWHQFNVPYGHTQNIHHPILSIQYTPMRNIFSGIHTLLHNHMVKKFCEISEMCIQYT